MSSPEPPYVASERHVTDRLVLRSYRPGDGPLLQEAVNASLDHLSPWMPWAQEPQSAEQAEGLCRTFRARWLLAENFVVGAFAPDESRLLGGTGFHLREGGLELRSAEIGMWIRADEAGRGLGTGLLVAMLRWGFADWPWLRLAWRCDTRNPVSLRVAEKAGMQREGTLRAHELAADGSRRDTACFAALRDEWTG